MAPAQRLEVVGAKELDPSIGIDFALADKFLVLLMCHVGWARLAGVEADK